ncbi:Uncharacterised protein [Salmonella enterica subsp. arizonae]|uniref:Uncharacterized protein n=1 Tax=Salmonella enterica subsp. arizonae TaxID=59203 RepID=A0A447R701_SALER|nr:hypothetical protein [Salmonella enterica]EIR2468238.1 hypothetical protein [Salmonella enterica subsp. enterica serovar Glostrup]VEA78056.1 Uncharacterised protein [Salmonella enterica subsp. arizonae]HEA0253745.1 hypothetical protein [Salmonella enterica]HEA0370737.1 hypothetical protein [Salmonella enterica]HEA0392456.1 hypothetical protein [Salmonella enterica]
MIFIKNVQAYKNALLFSLLEAISHISLNIASLSFSGEDKKERIGQLSRIISDLAELAMATNKISQIAAFLSGAQGSNHG